ncbi:MAG: hypothetical protein DLM53_00200 [Candidatus Eremiobacter antarcticus]|nr:MAG: hypothetical protein DLM53_00200 [Candidatus Eremiobacter sp. RRmetagenome_bin22]
MTGAGLKRSQIDRKKRRFPPKRHLGGRAKATQCRSPFCRRTNKL